MQFFKFGVIILDGPHRPLVDYKAQVTEKGTMFRIASPYGKGAKAVEQKSLVCENLNSGDTFLVIAPSLTCAYVWKGAGSDEAEHRVGQNLMEQLKMCESHVDVNEGEEPQEFWDILGGKGEYSS
jgi:hypothetical protein